MNSVRKRISRNDLGLTGGHQSGLVVPKRAVPLFPTLAEETLNPRMELEIADQDGSRSTATYIHYNNKVVGDGTRNEYRLTNMRVWFDANTPEVNDFVVFQQYAHDTLRVHHEATAPRGGVEAQDEFAGAPEGAKITHIVNAYERNEKNRRAVLKRFGYRCQACDVLLEESYGRIAKDYAHVHHTKPISTVGDGYVPNLERTSPCFARTATPLPIAAALLSRWRKCGLPSEGGERTGEWSANAASSAHRRHQRYSTRRS